jgi:hypothetical protein
MKYLAIAIMYVAFFGLIGFTVYFTNSALPLFALLLTPSVSDKKCDACGKES